MIDTELKIIKTIELKEATINLLEDDIVYVFYNDNTILDVPLQLKMLDLYHTITNGKKMPFIFEAGDNLIVTKEARDNSLIIEKSSPILSSVVIAQNLAYRMVANFFVKVQKPKGNYKIVSNLDQALNWVYCQKNIT